MNWVEIIGYTASVLIALSMAMKSIIKLRGIAIIGAVLFTLYGYLIHSLPVCLLNGFTALIHLYYLLQMKSSKEYFEIMRVPEVDAPFLQRFVKFYRKELSYYFPEFSLEKLQNPIIYIVFRNMIPAALFIAEPVGEKTLNVVVDFVTPDFRDLKSARYIFTRAKKIFGNKGYEKFVTRAYVRKHEKYLRKMGFKPVTREGQVYYERPI